MPVAQSDFARLLGPVAVSTGEREIDLGPPRQRSLFAALAAHTCHVVSRDELVDAVWGADPPVTVVNSVYTYVARLRRRLEPARQSRGPSSLLLSLGSGYKLLVPPQQIDKHRFEAHLDAARRLRVDKDLEHAVAELDTALALWRGNPYGGASGPFAEAERVRLTELRLSAMESRAEMLLELGRHPVAVGQLFGLVRQYPLRERLRHLLMQCYVGQGRQADALAEYHDLRRALADDLGVAPGDGIQRLYEQTLRREPVTPPPPAGPVAVSIAPARPVHQATGPAQLARDVPGFIGRRDEIQLLHDTVTAARRVGESAVLLVNGGPGTGKTALAVRFTRALSGDFPDGQLQIDLRGSADGAPPSTAAEALGDAISALGGRVDLPGSVGRLSTQYRSLAANRRLLVLLDDARSAEQVRPLLPGCPSCVVVITSRNRLTGLVARDGAQALSLGAMPLDDAVALLSRLVGKPFGVQDLPSVHRIVEACGRLPLALRIAAARLRSTPSPRRAVADFRSSDVVDFLRLPGDDRSSLRSVFDGSYRVLSTDAARMFRELGRHRNAELSLHAAAAIGETTLSDTRRLMDELLDVNLVQEEYHNSFRMNPLVLAYASKLVSERASCLAER